MFQCDCVCVSVMEEEGEKKIEEKEVGERERERKIIGEYKWREVRIIFSLHVRSEPVLF